MPYLNSRPLISGIEREVVFGTPSELARDLRAGRMEAALVPVCEYLEHPHYQIIPGIGIVSRGPVRSVYLAHRRPLRHLKRVMLDPASRTSNLMLQVILAEFFKLSPRYVTDENPGNDARLLIGDAALLERRRFLRAGLRILDLGEVWHRKTGLPFVYAFWAIREGLAGLPYIELFTHARQRGTVGLERIARQQKLLPPKTALVYLTRCIRYDLGSAQMEGLVEFQRLCFHYGLISQAAAFRLAA